MPRDGAIVFSDLIGKLDVVLRVACDKCGRDGRYQVQHLIDDRGRDGKNRRLVGSNHRRPPKENCTQYE
jgi:hypothetical protein